MSCIASRVAKRLKTYIRKVFKLQYNESLVPSLSPKKKKKKKKDTNKKILKNRNLIFPIVRYFTWKLKLVSDILWVFVGSTMKTVNDMWNRLKLKIKKFFFQTFYSKTWYRDLSALTFFSYWTGFREQLILLYKSTSKAHRGCSYYF